MTDHRKKMSNSAGKARFMLCWLCRSWWPSILSSQMPQVNGASSCDVLEMPWHRLHSAGGLI